MKQIPDYLLDNPDYYIYGGEEIITKLSEITESVDKILSKCNSIDFLNSLYVLNKKGESIFLLKETDELIGKHSYLDDNNGYRFLISSNLDTSFNKYEGYGKAMYVIMALDAMKQGKILASDITLKITIDGKYIWNSLVNLGFAEFDDNLNRFKFINNMLEDYFLEQ